MTNRAEGPVVVAVDGSEDGLRATRYGAMEASRGNRRLRLVHALHETVPWAPDIPELAPEAMRATAEAFLVDAERAAREVGGAKLDIDTEVMRGPRAKALLDRTEDASLVVAGTRHSAWKRVVTGSTSVALAARADCPVVCVPEGWAADDPHGLVVAAVDGSPASKTVLEAAITHCERRGDALVVAHAWRPSVIYDGGSAATVETEWRRIAAAQLDRIVEEAQSAHPDVKMTSELRYEFPADALTRMSDAADLMVVGRHGHGGLLGINIGGTARALIRTGACPVEIVPTPDDW